MFARAGNGRRPASAFASIGTNVGYLAAGFADRISLIVPGRVSVAVGRWATPKD